jgi:aspartyl-tRNA(Asn)/glutamyl-tRNA(Gln) amidotransferase subunit B
MTSENVSLDKAIELCNVQIGAVEGNKLQSIIEKICAENPDVVETIRSGQDKKDKKQKFLMGLVMKETRGQAKPDEVLKTLKEFFAK